MRFTEEETERIWDMHQAGVPVKRIRGSWDARTFPCGCLLTDQAASGLKPASSTNGISHSLNVKRSRGVWRVASPRGPSPRRSARHPRPSVGR